MAEFGSTGPRLSQTLSVPGGGLVTADVAPPPRDATEQSRHVSQVGSAMLDNMHGMRSVAVERNAEFEAELEDIRARVRVVEDVVGVEARARHDCFEALRSALDEQFSALEASISSRITEEYKLASGSLLPLRESLDHVQSSMRAFYDETIPEKAASFTSFHTAETSSRREAISMQDTVSRAWENNLSKRCERQQVLVAERQAAETSDRNAQIERLSKESNELLLRMKESALFSEPRLLKSLTEVKQSIAIEVTHRKEADEASQAVCFSTLHRIEKEALAAFGPPMVMIEEPAASSTAALSASASAAPTPSVAEEAAVVVAAMVDPKAASKKAAPTNTPAVAAAKPPAAAAAPKKK